MKEEQLHKQICEYIKLQYPKEIFNTDASGLRLSIGMAKKMKHLRSCRGIPDIVLYYSKNGYQSLFLEVKKETPFKKNGDLKKSEHLHEQRDVMQRLTAKGFRCSFVWTFKQAKELIDKHISGDRVEVYM